MCSTTEAGSCFVLELVHQSCTVATYSIKGISLPTERLPTERLVFHTETTPLFQLPLNHNFAYRPFGRPCFQCPRLVLSRLWIRQGDFVLPVAVAEVPCDHLLACFWIDTATVTNS
jgi:hypothetical protein